jgi:hypothetical protein
MRVQHEPTQRKQYSSEFKRAAVRLITEGSLSITQAAPVTMSRNFEVWPAFAFYKTHRVFCSTDVKPKIC